MEQPTSNQNSPNVKLQTKRTKTNLMRSFFLVVFLALATGVFLQVISLPKTCTEDPQSPIMKLESQIQKELMEIDRIAYDWLKNNLNSIMKICLQKLNIVLMFFVLSLSYFFVNSMYKDSAIETLALFVSLFGCWIMIFKSIRDYYFQDSSENCRIELTKNLHEVQLVCMFHFVMLAFIAFQQFLTKNCEN